MANVDNRVVAMKFDNKDFEKNVSGTMKSLDKLKQSLAFKGGKKGLEEVSKAAGNVNMSKLSGSISNVTAKFSALQTIGVAALATVASRATAAGLDIVKSLTLDNVIDGFKEYETNINSIQTILANTKAKGTGLPEVNAALDELNAYADLTIYNFAEMTRNIGTFTAAGVDLDTSVRSIKGIANIAAVSGSSSQQASTAMYQLSQAIATGSLKLQDWNSVVNAGMGGEVLQSALFETGKALGTLTDVPLEQSFQEWKDEGNAFRETLTDGWITSEVLTTTLEGFTGELDHAALSAKGYSDAQIAAIQDMAATATAAATEVKTATQLIDVVQEAIGSGWASTFRIVVGDFEEAKQLFSGIAAIITEPIGAMAEARNEVLEGWSAFGGRQAIIEGLFHALRSVLDVLRPIGEAFREVFPKKTTADLLKASARFRDFFANLKIGENYISSIKFAFKTLFQVVKIGFEVFKGVARVFGSVIKVSARLASMLVQVFGSLTEGGIKSVTDFLVAGEGIESFFDILVGAIDKAGDFLVAGVYRIGVVLNGIKDFFDPVLQKAIEFKNTVFGLFSGGGGDDSGGAGFFTQSLDRVKEALDGASVAGEKIGGVLAAIGGFFQAVGEKIGDAIGAVRGFFGDFTDGLTDAFSSENFAPAVAAVGTGFLGGITALLAYFAKNGLKLDFGQLDLFDAVTEAFEGLTDTLSAMQQNIKADTLKKIAIAVGVLAVSIIALSFIDGQALAKSLAAIGAGLGALLGGLFALSKVDATGLKMTGLATSLIVLSVAILVLAAAVKVFSSFDTDELIRGTIGIAVSLGIMAGAAKLMEKANGSITRAAFGMVVLGVALAVFAGAVGLFALLSIESIAKGLISIAVTLGILIGATQLIGENDILKLGGGFLLFAFALGGLVKVVKAFAGLSWDEMLRGMVGLAATLGILVLAVRALPDGNQLILVAGAMVILAGAVWIMSDAMISIAKLKFTDLIKGLIGLGAAMAILVIAANLMQGSIAGAAAIVVMAGAMWVMAEVLEKIGSLGLGTILIALLGIAGVLLVLGAAAYLLGPLVPVLFALGAALALVGAAFALFGVGGYLVAAALEKLGQVGAKSIDTLIQVIHKLLKALPGFAKSFAEGVFEFVKSLLEMAPQLIEAMGGILDALLNLIIEYAPKIGEMFGVLLQTGIDLMYEYVPKFIELGIHLLLSFGKGIADNIGMMVEIGVSIITNFLNGIAAAIPRLANAALNVITSFIFSLGQYVNRIIDAGVWLIKQFLGGLGNAAKEISQAVSDFIGDLIEAFTDFWGDLADAGSDAIAEFLGGLTEDTAQIIDAVELFITTLIDEIGEFFTNIADAGAEALTEFLTGLTRNVQEISTAARNLVFAFFAGLWAVTDAIITQGANFVINLIIGIANEGSRIISAGVWALTVFGHALVDNTLILIQQGAIMLLKFIHGLAFMIEVYAPLIRAAFKRLGWAIIEGVTAGIINREQGLLRSVAGLALRVGVAFANPLAIFSPSRVFMGFGNNIVEGLAMAIDKNTQAEESAGQLAKDVTNSFESGMRVAARGVEDMKDLNPRITPVLDLTRVEQESKKLGTLLEKAPIAAEVSLSGASAISAATLTADEATATEGETGGGDTYVTFEQTINSPTQLSTADIYRQTRGQITLAKEELNIP